MAYKTYKKGSTTKLSANFTVADFACHGVGCCTEVIINLALVELLQKIRDHFGVPVAVTSGYRCPVHNKNVNGATGSRHAKGDAADIQVKGYAPRVVAQYAESIGIKGIGLYETSADGFFVHIDTREVKSFWYGQAQKAMSTFGAYVEKTYDQTTAPVVTPAAKGDILCIGDKGEAVKILQENLVKLGYDCGKAGVDGDFGGSTLAAVRKFQSDHKLTVDGVYGPATKAAMDAALSKVGSAAAGKVKVTASVLNIRGGPGVSYSIAGAIRDRGVYEVTEVVNGFGKLKDGRGWICLDFTEKEV